jgi:hypothetical protein
MIQVKVRHGLKRYAAQSGISERSFRRLEGRVGKRMAEGAMMAARREMRRSLPFYWQEGQFLLKLTGQFGKFVITLDRRRNRRLAALIALSITGGRMNIPNADLRHYLIIDDNSFSPQRIYRILRAAHGANFSHREGPKVRVTGKIGQFKYAVVRQPNGILIFQRTGNERFRPASRLIAFLPFSIRLRPRFKLRKAIRVWTTRNRQRVIQQELRSSGIRSGVWKG